MDLHALRQAITNNHIRVHKHTCAHTHKFFTYIYIYIYIYNKKTNPSAGP